MFLWKYFFLYFGGGLILGLLSDSSNDSDQVNLVAGVLGLLIVGFLIWNFFTFGVGWGMISVFEIFGGMVAAVIIKGTDAAD